MEITKDAETGIRFTEQSWTGADYEMKLEGVEGDHVTLDVTASVSDEGQLDVLLAALEARRADLRAARAALLTD